MVDTILHRDKLRPASLHPGRPAAVVRAADRSGEQTGTVHHVDEPLPLQEEGLQRAARAEEIDTTKLRLTRADVDADDNR